MVLWPGRADGLGDSAEDAAQDFGHESPQVGQDQADVVAAAAQHRVEGVAGGALQRRAREAAIGFHVADGRFDGAAPSEVALQR